MTNTLPETLIALRTAYIASINELIARHPIQEQNRAYYMSLVVSSRLGRVKQPIAPKGSPALNTGELVLVWRPDWTPSDSATVWGTSSSSTIGCQKWSVEVVA